VPKNEDLLAFPEKRARACSPNAGGVPAGSRGVEERSQGTLDASVEWSWSSPRTPEAFQRVAGALRSAATIPPDKEWVHESTPAGVAAEESLAPHRAARDARSAILGSSRRRPQATG
jgi:hypothetical protein